jgi:hypothetical protein
MVLFDRVVVEKLRIWIDISPPWSQPPMWIILNPIAWLCMQFWQIFTVLTSVSTGYLIHREIILLVQTINDLFDTADFAKAKVGPRKHIIQQDNEIVEKCKQDVVKCFYDLFSIHPELYSIREEATIRIESIIDDIVS